MDITSTTTRTSETCGHSTIGEKANPLLLMPTGREPMPAWREDPTLEDPRLMRPWRGDRFGLIVGCEERPHNYTAALLVMSYFFRGSSAEYFGRIVFTGERFEYQGPGGANPPRTETDQYGFTRAVSPPWQTLADGQDLVLPFNVWGSVHPRYETRPVHFATVEESRGGILLHLKQVACFPLIYGLFPKHSAENTTIRCRRCGVLCWWDNCTSIVSIGRRGEWSNNTCAACGADIIPATWEEVAAVFAP